MPKSVLGEGRGNRRLTGHRPAAMAAAAFAALLFAASCSDFRSTAQADKGPPQEFGQPVISGDPSAPSDFRDTGQTEGGSDY
ncbi:MAG TPA: hypothetical protein VFR34_14530 [Paracoccaceae bacterium]|nr:hypothetical protein [Paracoccaceae bacterium]